jgi:sialic acid synthase SpsE
MSITGRASSVLLHCVTSYPAPEDQYNVALVPNLRAVFGVEVGLSDHSMDPVLVPALSVLKGGCVVEKHFTLSREGAGLDDPIALEPAQFARMVQAIREAESDPAAAHARLERDYGAPRIAAVLGTGVKRLAASEQANYGRTNRSLHALREIAKGELIREADVGLLRTERVLRPGLSPELLSVAVGARARRRIPNGEGIEWADLV